jgi:hypothetical protein
MLLLLFLILIPWHSSLPPLLPLLQPLQQGFIYHLLQKQLLLALFPIKAALSM